MDAVQLRVVHRMPGRMRLALPPGAGARQLDSAAETLRAQPGVLGVEASALTGRLLLSHAPEADLSAFLAPEPQPEEAPERTREAGAIPPMPRSRAGRALREDLRSSLPAGGLLAASLAKNYLLGGAGRLLLLDYAAVASTAYSVLSHGGEETPSRRWMHPDTIASILLLVAAQPAQLTGAALVMWVLNISEILSDHLYQEAAEERAAEGENGGKPLPRNTLLGGVARALLRAPGGVGEGVNALRSVFRPS